MGNRIPRDKETVQQNEQLVCLNRFRWVACFGPGLTSKEVERGTEGKEQNREQKGKYRSSLLREEEEEAYVRIMWQGFGSRGAAGVVSVRSPETVPC